MKLSLLISACLLGAAPAAFGFVSYINASGQPLRWNLTSPTVHTNLVNPATRAIRYFVGADAWSSANAAAERLAVRASFAQWQAVPGTILKFEEAGLAPAGIDIKKDNTNAVFWAKSSLLVNGGRDSISGRQGYTAVSFDNNNNILEADIVLNGIQHTWFTDYNETSKTAQFIEAILLHEIGHFVGLDHSPVGSATVTRGGGGVSTEAGLSSDEICAVKWLYPAAGTLNALGSLRGRVLLNGAPVFGAVVIAEDAFGNVSAGTVSQPNGSYELPALNAGVYQARACPLDPNNATDAASLIRGKDIAGEYASAQTSFKPTANKSATLAPGAAVTLDFTVAPGEPAFRITALSAPTSDPNLDSGNRFAHGVNAGQRVHVGVLAANLTSGASLAIPGDGIALLSTTYEPNRFGDGRNLLSVFIDVAENATPGMRSFVVQDGSELAYANGFLDLRPRFPDFNFDNLDDRFQRQFFAPFTAPEAAPAVDADADGFSNRYEYNSGTNPIDRNSKGFKLTSLVRTEAGPVFRWVADPGRRYQVYFKSRVTDSVWTPLGSPLTSRGVTMEFTDRAAAGESRYYRIELLP